MSIPITIIGGYLGAGKTTLLNRLLSQADDLRGLAILVNDFGAINIDAQLIRASSPDGQIISLTNGCVCCSIKDDFTASLETLREVEIKHILMEASGVALPVKTKAQCDYPGYHARACFVLIDAQHHQHQCADKFVGYLVKQQVEEADVLVITKKALAPDFIPPPNVGASVGYSFDVDDPELLGMLLDTSSEYSNSTPVRPDATTPDHTVAMTTCTLEQNSLVSGTRLSFLLDELPPQVQRVKGFVGTHQGEVLVQKVGNSCELSPLPSAQTHQLVFIASADASPCWQVDLQRAWHEWSNLS